MLGLFALVVLAACDSSAPAPPIVPGAATITPRPTPTVPGLQPPAILTGSPQSLPQAAPTGGAALPAPVQTGGPVSGTPITTAGSAADEPPRITDQDLLAHMQKGDVLVIDVRVKEFYDQKHIKGAILFPFETLDQRYGELPRDTLVVAYCQ